jgi:hypothetical protein
MAEQQYSIDLDLRELQAMVESLVPYIYQDELYGQLRITSARLTPGSLLLRLKRLQALTGQMTQGQIGKLHTLDEQHSKLRYEWSMAYNKKLTHEVESRTRDLNTFLAECKDSARLCANAYLPEALRRTILQVILDNLDSTQADATELKTKIKAVDSGLRRYIREAEFIWDAMLKPVYPIETYWWLYGKPPAE